VFDNRNFDASDGEPAAPGDRPQGAGARLPPRDHLPQTRSEVDANRIGVWGSSSSGAHVLVVGAIDRRVKRVAAQVPLSGAGSQAAGAAPRRPLRRLRQGLRHHQRRDPRLVPGAPAPAVATTSQQRQVISSEGRHDDHGRCGAAIPTSQAGPAPYPDTRASAASPEPHVNIRGLKQARAVRAGRRLQPRFDAMKERASAPVLRA
jgi:hypothetical protein